MAGEAPMTPASILVEALERLSRLAHERSRNGVHLQNCTACVVADALTAYHAAVAAETGKSPLMPSSWIGNPARALGWALDMMEMYEGRLIETFGDDERLVYSEIHQTGLRAACSLAEFATDKRGQEIYRRFRGRLPKKGDLTRDE